MTARFRHVCRSIRNLGACAMTLEFAAITYRAIRDRIRAEVPQIDEQTLPIRSRG
jgi:hypothetical protein